MNQATAGVAGNFVVLRAGSLRLVLPQQDVGAAEYMEHEPAASAQPGFFRYGEVEGARTAVALSEQMRPLTDFPPGRFVLTRLFAGGGELSFAWDEVRVLIATPLAPQPLPPAMRLPDAPIAGYVEYDGELLLCSSAARVLAYAGAMGD